MSNHRAITQALLRVCQLLPDEVLAKIFQAAISEFKQLTRRGTKIDE
ncbi:MAG: hypothetical protein KME17_08510 [Cyanosarcina radialis HA8281-LM2]|nr:hypothetical protein [Cyanosarcina radialis HA8281-LM2]